MTKRTQLNAITFALQTRIRAYILYTKTANPLINYLLNTF